MTEACERERRVHQSGSAAARPAEHSNIAHPAPARPAGRRAGLCPSAWCSSGKLADPPPRLQGAGGDGGNLANDCRKESRWVGNGRAPGNRITCAYRLPRADGRVPQAASVRARYHRAPHASETAFRCRVRPMPLPQALPSAYSGSGHAVPPLPPTGRDAHREAELSMSPRQSSSFSQAPGGTTRKPSKTNSPASISLVVPVKIHAAFPATASSTKWLSDSSRRFGRQRYEMLIHWQAPRTASNSAVRSSGPIGAAANNFPLDRTSSYSRNNALPVRGRAVPVRHLGKTSRAAPSESGLCRRGFAPRRYGPCQPDLGAAPSGSVRL